jgi:hypothetical protein
VQPEGARAFRAGERMCAEQQRGVQQAELGESIAHAHALSGVHI